MTNSVGKERHRARAFRPAPGRLRLLAAALLLATALSGCSSDGAVRFEPVLAERGALPTSSPGDGGPLPSTTETSPLREATGATSTSGAADPSSPSRSAAPRSELIGFYVDWDETSYQSLQMNVASLTSVMPMWYRVDKTGRVTASDQAAQLKVLTYLRTVRPELPIMPIVANGGTAAGLAAMLGDPDERDRLVAEIVDAMRAGGFDGVNVDFEALPASAKDDLVDFMRALTAAGHKAGLVVSQDITLGGAAFDIPRLGAASDFIVPMMYDQHWKTSPAGPIAAQDWYEAGLRKVFAAVPPNKVVLALGAWTYDWATGTPRATSYTYSDALALARDAGTPVDLDAASLNPTFAFAEGSVTHRLWMLDAVTLFNQVKVASASSPRGYALWRLGHEDPAAWKVLARRDGLDASVAWSLQSEARDIGFDAARGLIVSERIRP